MSAAQPGGVPGADFDGTLGSYQFKLHMIVHEMELCKAALGEWRLSAHQAILANQLVTELERSVEELGAAVASHIEGILSRRISGAISIDLQLENVCALCDTLMSIICRRPQVVELPA